MLCFSEIKLNQKLMDYTLTALQMAAAGGHSVLMLGPHGSGQTMLSRRVPGILPTPTDEELAQIRAVYEEGNVEPPSGRPFRAPHHTISVPGFRVEWERARGGVLLVDELDLFRADVKGFFLNLMDGRTEDDPLVIATMSRCRCNYRGSVKHTCRCYRDDIVKYRDHNASLRAAFDIVLYMDDSTPTNCSYEPPTSKELRRVIEQPNEFPAEHRESGAVQALWALERACGTSHFERVEKLALTVARLRRGYPPMLTGGDVALAVAYANKG